MTSSLTVNYKFKDVIEKIIASQRRNKKHERKISLGCDERHGFTAAFMEGWRRCSMGP